jgi:hypothetical protein
MRRDLERRLRRLEIANTGSKIFEIWIDQGDGTVCGPLGQRLTRQALDHAHSRGHAYGDCVVIVIDAQDALA